MPQRREELRVRASLEELESWKRAAQAEGESLSQFVRLAIQRSLRDNSRARILERRRRDSDAALTAGRATDSGPLKTEAPASLVDTLATIGHRLDELAVS
jgi:hypothetical protein